MPLPGTPHVAKITMGYTNNVEDNKCENILYVQDSTDGIFADIPTFVARLVTAYTGTVRLARSAFVVLDNIGFEDVRTFPFGGVSVGITPIPGASGIGGIQLPASVSLAVKKTSAVLGRSGRGRLYEPIGSASSLINGNTVDPVYANLVTAEWQAFQAIIETGSPAVELGFVSYFSARSPRVIGLFHQITGWSATDLNVDSQRRRLPGRGQ